VSQTATLRWFAGHELRLAWRDWLSMMTAGKRGRERTLAIALTVFAVFMHLIAYVIVARYAAVGVDPDKATLIAVTGSVVLSFSLMLSQGMESVTRAFYARSDLDLILSSPVAARRVFAVRIAALAGSTSLLGMLIAAPFIDVLAIEGGVRWLAAYGVVAAMGFSAAALAVAITVGLFRVIGPKRTRFVAQIIAAVIGAAFIIGLQIAAILSYGTLSRFAVLESGAFIRHAPELGSIIWWPARAMLGDGTALAAVFSASLLLLAATIVIFSARFGDHAVAAAGAGQGGTRRQRASAFRAASQMSALRRKEWTLLRRDPWLMSQTLMQLLYLLPPALLLWRSFAEGNGGPLLLVPVLVMAAGQLAGGLAWLAISGEDAPDLVATAPVTPSAIMRAKVQSVMTVIALVFLPFVLPLAFGAMSHALAAAAGIALAAGSSTAIQFWFATQAKRSHFRRRQTSSRIATFAEAFSSVTWAAAAGLAAAESWLAAIVAIIALIIVGGTWLLAPRSQAR
jgi:ABC-2 type transport system permease protein